ncbi:MAG: PAS domain S-box protein [Chloroflexi bacterium]|nr:PAS domain S-box protein [Chloroflexota bacterium]
MSPWRLIWRSLAPPSDPRYRLRWWFVVGGLANVAFLLAALALRSDAPLLQRVVAATGAMCLGYMVIQGYNRKRYPRWSPILEMLVIGLATATVGDVRQVIEVFYVGLFFRILWGAVSEVVWVVLAYSVAYVVAALAWPVLTGATPSTHIVELLSNLFGLAVVGALKWGMADASNLSLAMASRERTLGRAATSLTIASDRQTIYSVALEAAQRLLRGTPATRVALEIGQDEVFDAVLSRSKVAKSLHEHVLPVSLRGGDEVARFRIESGKPWARTVDVETEAGLTTLAAELSMALERADLIESLTQEVAERKRAEESLLLRDRALAVATSPVVIVNAQHDDRPIVYVNAAFEQLTGYTSEEIVGETLRLLIGPETDLETVARLARAAAEGRADRGELGSYRKDGQLIWLEVAGAPVRAADGTLTHCVWVYADITQRREAERQARALAQAEKQRALGQLASGIAHDLNQSLMLIASHGNLGQRALQQDPIDVQELREALTVVTQAALDGGQTVKRLLVFAQAPTDGAMQLLDLTALARDVVQLTSPRWRDATQAEGRPIEVCLETRGHPAIIGPKERLREALMNLVLNSVDAMPQGGTITVRVFSEDDRACVDVTDTGTGMPPEVRARIFEPFFTTKGEAGTGLGLPTVFGLVEHLKGHMEVETAAGAGTTFRLQFPLSQEIQSTPAATPATTQQSSAQSETAQRRQLRILAVDDEPAITRAVLRLLRPAGHVVSTADSAEQALERLASNTFDLVVSDLGLGSGMNGWDLAERVRQAWPETRFVLATGWGATIDPVEARQRGVDAVLSKPYAPEELERVVAAA